MVVVAGRRSRGHLRLPHPDPLRPDRAGGDRLEPLHAGRLTRVGAEVGGTQMAERLVPAVLGVGHAADRIGVRRQPTRRGSGRPPSGGRFYRSAGQRLYHRRRARPLLRRAAARPARACGPDAGGSGRARRADAARDQCAGARRPDAAVPAHGAGTGGGPRAERGGRGGPARRGTAPAGGRDTADAVVDTAPPATSGLRPAPVPVPPTALLGRDADVAALADQLADGGVRLVTLTGVGGVGKSRLAIEVARRAAPSFPRRGGLGAAGGRVGSVARGARGGPGRRPVRGRGSGHRRGRRRCAPRRAAPAGRRQPRAPPRRRRGPGRADRELSRRGRAGDQPGAAAPAG